MNIRKPLNGWVKLNKKEILRYECEICGKIFDTQENIREHIKKKHPYRWKQRRKA